MYQNITLYIASDRNNLSSFFWSIYPNSWFTFADVIENLHLAQNCTSYKKCRLWMNLVLHSSYSAWNRMLSQNGCFQMRLWRMEATNAPFHFYIKPISQAGIFTVLIGIQCNVGYSAISICLNLNKLEIPKSERTNFWKNWNK